MGTTAPSRRPTPATPFLNPDTETVEGTYADLVTAMDARPEVGLAGVRQLTGNGELWPTIRRFPNALRALAQSVGSERWLRTHSWACERELDLSVYDREVECDWTSGSFMLARREAFESAGFMDERFFIYAEEPDLCRRITNAGWGVRHLPTMTIIHHAGKAGLSPKMESQDAYARKQYARKHFSAPHRAAYLGALGLGYAVRSVARGDARRLASRRALRVLSGAEGGPFGPPPAQAVAIRGTTTS